MHVLDLNSFTGLLAYIPAFQMAYALGRQLQTAVVEGRALLHCQPFRVYVVAVRALAK